MAGAQSRQAVAPTYEPGIDVAAYDVTIEIPDTGAFIRGDVTVALHRARGVSHFWLDLVDALTVRRVEVNGAVVQSVHRGNRIEVPLPGTRDSMSVRVVYDGVVADGLVARKDEKGRWTWFGDNWPDRGRQWLPLVDHPSDKATVSWRVIAPSALTVVANGEQVSRGPVTVRGTERTETRWRETRPIAPYLMVIAVGTLDRYDLKSACHVGDQGQCVKQSVYVFPENDSWLPGSFGAADSIVSFYERLVGPFPYEKLAHLQSSTRFGGMENASAIFYDGRLFPAQRVSDDLIAHETAHQWFGDAVTEREWAHLWLSEGFATYFAALWAQHSHGDSAFHQHMQRIRQQVMNDKVVATRPVIDTAQHNYLALLNANSYQKGGYVLYMLHQRLGDSAFFGALQSYYRKYRHGTALTDDLQHEFELAGRQPLGDFFNQWLRRPGVPAIGTAWSYHAASGQLWLTFSQDDQALYGLTMPLEIVDGAGVTRRMNVDVPAKSQSRVRVPMSFTASPRSVTFDPLKETLARLTAK